MSRLTQHFPRARARSIISNATPGMTCAWDGVRNEESCNFLKQVKLGDQVFWYQLHGRDTGVVGVLECVEECYPDPTQFIKGHDNYDPTSRENNPKWMSVRLRAIKQCETIVHPRKLKALKEEGEPAAQDLVHNLNNRHLYVVRQNESMLKNNPLVSRRLERGDKIIRVCSPPTAPAGAAAGGGVCADRRDRRGRAPGRVKPLPQAAAAPRQGVRCADSRESAT